MISLILGCGSFACLAAYVVLKPKKVLIPVSKRYTKLRLIRDSDVLFDDSIAKNVVVTRDGVRVVLSREQLYEQERKEDNE
jgi:hypothetical protein